MLYDDPNKSPKLEIESLLDVADQALKEAVNPESGISLPWWPIFDDLIGGLRKHELTIITAPTGSGKTQFLANISAQLLLSDNHQFVASVETGRTDYCRRVMSALTRKDINRGEAVSPELAKSIAERTRFLFRKESIWFSNCEYKVDSREMVKHLEQAVKERSVNVALLDNLNFFMKLTRPEQERMVMDDAIHQFVQLVKKLPIHVILVMHPRKVGRDNRIENENEIKGSSTAAQEASNVILYNRPSEEDVESGRFNWTHRELKFVKLRKRGWNYGKRCHFEYDNGMLKEHIPIS